MSYQDPSPSAPPAALTHSPFTAQGAPSWSMLGSFMTPVGRSQWSQVKVSPTFQAAIKGVRRRTWLSLECSWATVTIVFFLLNPPSSIVHAPYWIWMGAATTLVALYGLFQLGRLVADIDFYVASANPPPLSSATKPSPAKRWRRNHRGNR